MESRSSIEKKDCCLSGSPFFVQQMYDCIVGNRLFSHGSSARSYRIFEGYLWQKNENNEFFRY